MLFYTNLGFQKCYFSHMPNLLHTRNFTAHTVNFDFVTQQQP